MRVKKLYKEYLPTKLIKEINKVQNDQRDYRGKDNILLMIGSIFDKMLYYDSISLNSYLPLSSAYWKKIIGSNYSIYAKVLNDNNLVQTQLVEYTSDDGKISIVKGYRINPVFLNDSFGEIEYHQKKSSAPNGTDDEFKEFNLKGLNQLSTKFSNIRLNKKDALEWLEGNASCLVEKFIDHDFVDELPSKESIKVKILFDDENMTSQYLSVESAKKISSEQGKELFYYKDTFIIADKALFKELKAKKLIYKYRRDIGSFHPDSFNFKRNPKTLRVYSQLTSLPSALLQFVRINNDYLMQADLKCSQFTIFANLLNLYITEKNGEKLVNLFKKKPTKTFVQGLIKVFENHVDLLPMKGLNANSPLVDELEYRNNDIYRFLVDVLLYDFYVVLQKELNLPERSFAKTMAFTTVFSNPKRESYYSTRFREKYPSVISIINEFKNKFGYNKFAIGLQNVEAEIFVDHIWKTALKSNVNSFTRHDSLAFPLSMRAEVEKLINKVFEEFKFIYRIDYESPNESEYMQYLYDYTQYLDSLGEEFDELYFYSMEHSNSDKGGQGETHKLLANTEIFDDMENENDESLDEVYSYDNLEYILEREDLNLPYEIEDDYHGIVPLELLEVLIQLKEINQATRKALQEDIENLGNNLHVQYPAFQKETNKLITSLILTLG